jgi:hypothetical protein
VGVYASLYRDKKVVGVFVRFFVRPSQGTAYEGYSGGVKTVKKEMHSDNGEAIRNKAASRST